MMFFFDFCLSLCPDNILIYFDVMDFSGVLKGFDAEARSCDYRFDCVSK